MSASDKAVDLSTRRPERLAGPGLVLREWGEDDLFAMVALFDDPDIALRTPLPSPFTLDRARERLVQAHLPDRLLWAITANGEQPLGEVLLKETGELGYVLGARHRGAGLATRALRIARDHAHAIGLAVLRLEIEADNTASAAVALRAGFRLVHEAAEVVEDKGRRFRLDVWEHLQVASTPSAHVRPDGPWRDLSG